MADPPILHTVNGPSGLTSTPIDYIESSFVQSSIRPDGQSAVRHVQVKDVDREDFEAAMLGYSIFDPVVPASPLFRFVPESHPRRLNLIARSVDFVRELGPPTTAGPGSTLEYGGTLLTGGVELAVTYEATPGVMWSDDTQAPEGITHEGWRYTRVMEKFDIEQRLIPIQILKFNADDKPINSPGTQLVPSSVLTIDWYQVPAVLDAQDVPQLPGNLQAYWTNTQGRINDDTFFGCPAYTLYCAAPERELITMADGKLAWNIKYQLYKRGHSSYDDLGPSTTITDGPNWKRLLRGNGRYGRIYRSFDIAKIVSLYDVADFYNLFRFGLDAPAGPGGVPPAGVIVVT